MTFELFQEIREQAKTVAPTLASFLLYRMPWLISLRFVGRIGAQELAAAAFANSLCNILGMALSVGLDSAMTTLASQARGDLQARQQSDQEKKQQRVCVEVEMASLLNREDTDETETSLTSESSSTVEDGEGLKEILTPAASSRTKSNESLLQPIVYLYRGLFIQLLFVIPVSCWWLYGIQPLLLRLGQAPQLSLMTERYLRLLAPGLIGYSITRTMCTWLQAIQMPDVPPIVAAVGLACHIPITYVSVHTWGYLGCAVATSAFQFIQPLQLIVYHFFTQSGNRRALDSMGAVGVSRRSFWNEAKAAVFSLSGFLQYLGLAVPGLIAISEWWASEVLIVLAGRLQPSPELALGAMTLFQSLNSLCFIFPISFSIAGAMRVGNLLGANQASAAAFASKVTLGSSVTVSGILAILLVATPHSFFPSLFAPSAADLIQETSRLIPLLSLYVVGDAFASGFNGVIKGCGRQAVAVPVVLVSYWVVGIPAAYYMAFVRHDGELGCDNNSFFCGDRGLVLGSTVGTWLHALLLGMVVSGGTDWKAEARKAGERVGRRDNRLVCDDSVDESR